MNCTARNAYEAAEEEKLVKSNSRHALWSQGEKGTQPPSVKIPRYVDRVIVVVQVKQFTVNI